MGEITIPFEVLQNFVGHVFGTKGHKQREAVSDAQYNAELQRLGLVQQYAPGMAKAGLGQAEAGVANTVAETTASMAKPKLMQQQGQYYQDEGQAALGRNTIASQQIQSSETMNQLNQLGDYLSRIIQFPGQKESPGNAAARSTFFDKAGVQVPVEQAGTQVNDYAERLIAALQQPDQGNVPYGPKMAPIVAGVEERGRQRADTAAREQEQNIADIMGRTSGFGGPIQQPRPQTAGLSILDYLDAFLNPSRVMGKGAVGKPKVKKGAK